MSPAVPSNVAAALLDRLSAWGVQVVFTVPGLQIDPLNRALAARPDLRAVVANHELAAGYMADGHARASGRPGAVFAIGGPGCANLLGAAVAAKADRSPVLFVTGNIPRAAQGRGEFQDGGPEGSNDAGLGAAALGESLVVAAAEDLPQRLAHARQRLLCGTPVHLSLGYDVQVQVAAAMSTTATAPAAHEAVLPPPEDLAQPRVAVFADVEALPAADALRALLQRCGLPLATTLAARGLLDDDDPLSAGHLGFMPDPRAQALLSADSPWRAQTVLQMGGDALWTRRLRERHGRVLALPPTIAVEWLAKYAAIANESLRAQRQAWCAGWQGLRRAPAGPSGDGLTHASAIEALAAAWPADSCWVVDAGQVRRIAVLRLRCRQPRSLFIAEGMAPMGWSLGAAIGVALAQPTRPVVALLGDGAMRMHGIEIATAVRYRLPILYVLFDNQAYGSVLQRMATAQERAQAELPAVDWTSFARAFGLACWTAADAAGLQHAVHAAAAHDGPRLLVLRVPAVDPEAHAHATGIDWQLPGDASVET